MTADGRSSLEDACNDLIAEAAALTEQLRVKKLRSLNVLERPFVIYNDLVALAAQVTDMPFAALTFIDDTTTTIACSFEAEGSSYIELPPLMERCDTVCNTTIITPQKVNIILDTHLDVRFENHSKVKDGTVRFYCGVPLTTEDGYAIGSLCVFDDKPRTIEEGPVKALQALARTILQIAQLNSVKLY